MRSKYVFRPERYKGTFLARETTTYEIPPTAPADHVIYSFWTGDNEITDNRKKNLERMNRSCGVPVILVTPENLHRYILAGHPLHPAYEHLSNVHKSDYLRTYFMHHHGGGYSDIKEHTHNWVKAFDKLEQSGKWLLGYREIGPKGIARTGGVLEQDLAAYWPLLVGNCAYICRPGTPFTHEWYTELLRRMDNYREALEKNPGNIWGNNEGYPVPWTGILGDIFHPLCLKYHAELEMSDLVKPSFRRYR